MAGSAWQLRYLQVKIDGDWQAIPVMRGDPPGKGKSRPEKPCI